MLRYIAITGRPGIGKTTLFWRVVKRLMSEGYNIVGFYCPEVREHGVRIGFKIVLLDGSGEGWLARREGCNGPRVGRYYTCREAEEVAAKILERVSEADLIAIDEIGPMELKLPGVRRVIYKVFETGKPGFFVVHERLSDRLVTSKLREAGQMYTVTVENRDMLVEEIYGKLKSIIKSLQKR